MKTRQNSSYSRAHRTAALGACVFFLSAFVSSAFGAPTDISNVPSGQQQSGAGKAECHAVDGYLGINGLDAHAGFG
jgi:hypothetical protein